MALYFFALAFIAVCLVILNGRIWPTHQLPSQVKSSVSRGKQFRNILMDVAVTMFWAWAVYGLYTYLGTGLHAVHGFSSSRRCIIGRVRNRGHCRQLVRRKVRGLMECQCRIYREFGLSCRCACLDGLVIFKPIVDLAAVGGLVVFRICRFFFLPGPFGEKVFDTLFLRFFSSKSPVSSLIYSRCDDDVHTIGCDEFSRKSFPARKEVMI
jgi:hypothetical protein